MAFCCKFSLVKCILVCNYFVREFRQENELGHTNLNLHSLERACSKEQNDTKIVQIGQSIDFL